MSMSIKEEYTAFYFFFVEVDVSSIKWKWFCYTIWKYLIYSIVSCEWKFYRWISKSIEINRHWNNQYCIFMLILIKKWIAFYRQHWNVRRAQLQIYFKQDNIDQHLIRTKMMWRTLINLNGTNQWGVNAWQSSSILSVVFFSIPFKLYFHYFILFQQAFAKAYILNFPLIF